jgi:hypothetical protein
VKKEGEGASFSPCVFDSLTEAGGIDPGNSLYFNMFFSNPLVRGRKAKPMKPFDPAAGCISRYLPNAHSDGRHPRAPALSATLA